MDRSTTHDFTVFTGILLFLEKLCNGKKSIHEYLLGFVLQVQYIFCIHSKYISRVQFDFAHADKLGITV